MKGGAGGRRLVLAIVLVLTLFVVIAPVSVVPEVTFGR